MPRASLRASRTRYQLFFITAAIIVAADQATKHWIRANLDIGETLWRYGILSIVRVQPNTGASFGLFQGYTVWLIALTFIFLICLLGYVFFFYRRVPWMNRPLFWVALGLILGGSVGNLVDRVHPALRAVTDFISIGWWPTFNVADPAVITGAVLFVLGFLIYGRHVSGETGREA